MTTDGVGRIPTAAEEARLWDLVESAWAACGPDAASARLALVERDPALDGDNRNLYALDTWTDEFLTQLRALCADLSSDELTDLDRVVERKLHDLDRQDIHEHTDGSDDGFLYCRGFIVAAGRRFYLSVAADPAMAVLDAECQAMCYFFAPLHNARFGCYPVTGSNISRESGRNPHGW
ncbi:DUF4240 domain-containing protein [Paractinoplanes hotanensis]|uniref:DUF4240 domain-containing protein n=1 Tax=Paractinoplanes hotanensis TaxID=2906497 RepID=A0ABT0YHE5_9ACTN|nr:DUF4240 domain-containing protein [Actinoplanes hotanensis]MCM4084649.1 DUF4240 domain-containing protein [Actinoplanes hotanensis]